MDTNGSIDRSSAPQSEPLAEPSQARGRLVCAGSGRVIECDLAAAAMLGFDGPTDLVGSIEDLSDLFAEPVRGGATLLRAIASGGTEEQRWLRADGSSTWVVLGVRPAEGGAAPSDPADERVEVEVREVTARRHLEAQLQDAQERGLWGQVVTGMVHDMNNILAAVLAQAELAEGSLEIGDVVGMSQDLDGLRQTAMRGSRMVQHILSFSSGEGLALRTVNLAQGVQAAARLIRPVLPHGIAFRVVADQAPLVQADMSAVERILLRLTRAAQRAMPDGGTLAIRVEHGELTELDVRERGWGTSGRYGVVTVSDNGVGLEPGALGRIFEPFGGRATGEAGDPSGMALVYALMKQHRGFVDIDSMLGRGTRVRLYFPMALDPRRVPLAGSAAERGSRSVREESAEPSRG